MAKNMVTKQLGVDIQLGYVDFRFPSKAVLGDVVVPDLNDCEMIRVDRLEIDMFSISLWGFITEPDSVQSVSVESVSLINPYFSLYKQQDGAMNLDFLTQKKNDSIETKPLQLAINVEKIKLENGTFRLQDSTRPTVHEIFLDRMNFENLWVAQINGDLSFSMVPQARTEIGIKNLSAKEQHCNFFLENLTTDVVNDTFHSFDAKGNCEIVRFLEFNSLQVDAHPTHLRANVRFDNQYLLDLFDPYPKERYVARIQEIDFAFATLNYFVPKPVPLDGIVKARGTLIGGFNDVRSNNFEAKHGEDIYLIGKVSVDDFQHDKKMELDISFDKGTVSAQGLRDLLVDVELPSILDTLGRVQLKGNFKGKYYDFDADAMMRSGVGHTQARLHMKLPPLNNKIGYDGYVETKNLNLNQLGFGKILPSNDFNFKGSIKGEGVRLETVHADFNAEIINSDLLGYEMKSVIADVEVEDRKMKGDLKINDFEGFADVEVDLDLAREKPFYKVKGKVEKLNIAKYKIYKDPFFLTSELDVEMEGDSIEEMNGVLRLDNALLERAKDSAQMKLDRFRLVAGKTENDSIRIKLTSSYLNGDVRGDFTVKNAISLTKRLIKEAQLFFTNEDSLIQDYYANKELAEEEVKVYLSAISKEGLNELFSFLGEPLYVSPAGQIQGELTFGQFDHAFVELKLDSVAYEHRSIHKGKAYVDLTKYTNQNAVLMVGGVELDSLHLGKNFTIDTVNLDVQWFDNQIEYTLIGEQSENGNRLQMQLTSEFLEDGRIVSSINPRVSYITLDNSQWHVSQSNTITYLDKAFEIKDFLLEADMQFLKIAGSVSDKPDNLLDVSMHSFDLHIINDLFPDVNYDINGLVFADVKLRDIFTELKFDAEGIVKRIQLDELVYGDVLIDADWQKGSEKVHLIANLVEKPDTFLAIEGTYDIQDKEAPLDFYLNSQTDIPLTYISPFVKEQIYDIGGSVQLDKFRIKGSFDDLDIQGKGHFNDATFGVDYFKTKYSFNGIVDLDKDRITFPTITLYDKNKNSANFYGVIRHRSLKEFVFDLQLDEMSDFLMMDTKKTDNELFYGTVYARDGVASVSGDLSKLNINAYAIPGKNSVFNIPISDVGNLERPNFIYFVGDEEEERGKVKTGLQGFNLNLTVSANPDAHVNLIFDEKVGDIISGSGEGNINVTINEEGDFSMFGNYQISEGEYLFTAQNIVNKKFVVKESESKINWAGDPYEAEVDIQAIYPLNADIKEIIRSENSVRVPVNVLMRMKGSLLQPEIELSIELPNLTSQDAIQIVSYLKTIQYDEQELNKQVFSLMVFNRFAPVGGFFGQDAANSGVTNSISELLSNQLNYWLSQALDDKISVAFGSNNLEDVNLLVSARL